MHVTTGSLHRPDRVNEGRIGAGMRVLIGLVGVGRGDHGAGLGRVLLEANVRDIGGVALRGTKAQPDLKPHLGQGGERERGRVWRHDMPSIQSIYMPFRSL